MEYNELTKLKGKLFSGEYRERSTNQLRKFGGVLESIDGSMVTFKGRYKTFILDFRTIESHTYREIKTNGGKEYG